MKKGFTLIEILIVVAIIAILASVVLIGLGPTQQSGRDARRLSDLHQSQNAIELYYQKCGFYPGGANCAAAVDDDYAAMVTAVTAAATNIGIAQMPLDPTNSGIYAYFYGTNGTGSNYTIGATLENVNNSVFKNYNFPASAPIPATHSCVSPEYCMTL